MALQNKLFTSNTIPENHQVSRVRNNREYLITPQTAHELNTYMNFGIFKSFNDVYSAVYKPDDNYTKPIGKIGTPGVRSIFNKAGAVLVGQDGEETVTVDSIINKPSEFRITNNVPLMDSPATRAKIKNNSGCSIKELVKASEEGMLGRAIYAYSDFMYCKHLGKMPNNHLITLRRFPTPVGDAINAMGVGKNRKTAGKNTFGQQIGCLVNWIGVSGNELGNLLKYSVNMPFSEQDAQWNDMEVDGDSQGGIGNAMAAAFDPEYRKQQQAGYNASLVNNYMGKFFNVAPGPYDAKTEANFEDYSKVYGPVDRVKSVYIRDGKKGIKFEQSITIVFEYELKSYNGINPRQAMLDLLSNILNVVYTTGDFWGGGYKGGGMHQNSIYANMRIFKARGGVTDFIDEFSKDVSGARDKLNFNFSSLVDTALAALNQLGGMLIAGALNKLGRPQKVLVNSLLSEAPVGLWHVTIGNPYHPILSMGNMILTNTTIEHTGPLGLDDFPTGLKVTCELTRGKPRDLREIEKMYMLGNDRIYHGMGPKVFDMYKAAQDYQSKRGISFKQYESFIESGETAQGEKAEVNNNDKSKEVNITKITGMSESDLKSMGNILQKYFGETDTYSIYVAAAEQEYGSQKRKSKNDARHTTSKPTEY